MTTLLDYLFFFNRNVFSQFLVFIFFSNSAFVGFRDFLSEEFVPTKGVFLLEVEGLLDVFTHFSSLFLDSGLSLGLGFFLSLNSGLLDELGIWIKEELGIVVGEWILLLYGVCDFGVASWLDDTLDFVGVDDSGEIGVGHQWSLQLVIALLLGSISVGSEDLIEVLESGLSPDDESAHLSSWSELNDVQSLDIADVDAWNVSDGLDKVDVLVEAHNHWTLLHGISSVSGLASSGSDGFAVNYLLDIFEGTDFLEYGNNLFGFFNLFNLVTDHQWKFHDILDLVASAQNKGDNTGGGDSGNDSMSLLVCINSSVPSSPGLDWGEHSTLSALVAEGTLA